MNPFLASTKRMIALQGRTFSYTANTVGSYNVETGAVTSTTVVTNITAYKQHVVANQYNYPTLIGKELAHFYVAGDALASKPKAQDKITDGSVVYTVLSVIEQEARGQICLFKVLATKG
jgi:translation elongation factor EF-1alpha